ncbi:Rad52/Rad22 family DNA repair protein [Streptomyces pseudovenezuelae]
MAAATEALASTTAEGPTSHTQNQADQTARRRGELSPAQIGYLLRGIDPMRVGKDGKGFAHVEAWDIRRHMIRVFGFGGFDTDLIDMHLVEQIDIPPEHPNGKTRYTVVYRMAVKLTVKVDGLELGHWHGAAIGDATNQPSLADAHDLALKTADSQALKRAAVNMGDQFGLSLYNKGRLDPVVQGSLAYLKPRSEQEFKDDKVEPEPEVAAAREQSDPAPTLPAPSERLAALLRQVSECWKSDNLLIWNQIGMDGDRHGVLDEEFAAKDGTVTTLRKVLDGRIAEIQAAQGGAAEGQAA